DTTANTLAWMMHLMALHPEVQLKMRAEVDRVLGQHERPPDWASTEALSYVEAVTQEVMRLKPVAPLLALETNVDVLVGDVQVPAGTSIFLLPSHAAVAASNFTEPAAFRPERWIAAAGRTLPGHNTRAFVPFGAGP